ncbi:hypothetical protein ACL6C3_09290 [Capilliphycus salinus ALCB114379]|uniref:hypothetical protein n=1 Tax=Capilliphycus salinus TaxID=2768948 RepID=UPI0039A4A6F3
MAITLTSAELSWPWAWKKPIGFSIGGFTVGCRFRPSQPYRNDRIENEEKFPLELD